MSFVVEWLHWNHYPYLMGSVLADTKMSATPLSDAAYRQLLDLLAMLHRDGGHHTARVGLDQSIEDAVKSAGECCRESLKGYDGQAKQA